MRAVVAAFVLIVGAAVVLWYGNTLNSWVLGGLIGGLAALLLSIPISLTIFSFLSRHHDKRLRPQEEEYEPEYEYPAVPERVTRSMYVVEEERPRRRHDTWEEEDEWRDEEEEYPRARMIRQLPTPAQPRLPAPQRNVRNTKKLPVNTRQLTDRGALSSGQLTGREREMTSRRPTQQRMNYPGFPGYQAETPHSQLRSQALRAARMEAARRREEDEVEELPSYRPRRSPSPRPDESLLEFQEDEPSMSPRTQQGARQYPRRSRRIIDADPASDEGSWQSANWQQEEPETEYIDPTLLDSDLKKPLVRRAPYMYEDDPLRKQLSRQVDGPITRRSSRHLSLPPDEE